MIRFILPFLFVIISTTLWADDEILSQQHESVGDYQHAWGKEIHDQNSILSSGSTRIHDNPHPSGIEKNDSLTLVERLPVHEKHTPLVVAQGYVWCCVKRNGIWQLLQAKNDGRLNDWNRVSGDLNHQILDMKLNQEGDLSLLLKDDDPSTFHQQSILIHSGASTVTCLNPAPLAGNLNAAKQQWEKHCGNEPLLMNEFDLEKEGEFLALTHSIRDSGLTVRYRISPGLGQPFSIWSAPIPAGSQQIKKDGRFLQYQIIADENNLITSVPTVSLTYTHLDSPPRKQEESVSKAIPSSLSEDTNQDDSILDTGDLEQDSNSENQALENNSPEDNQQENSQDQDRNKNQSTNDDSIQEDNSSVDSTEKENQQNPGESNHNEKQAGPVEEADQNTEKQTEISPQEVPVSDESDLPNQPQEQNNSPTQQPPNQVEPEKHSEESEPEFTSPFNQRIGILNQQPEQNSATQQDSQPETQEQSNSTEPEPQQNDQQNNQQNDPNNEENNTEQPDNNDPIGSEETGSGENSRSDAEEINPTPNQDGTPSQPGNNNAGNPVNESSGSPMPGNGMPNQGNANSPQVGMPQEEGNGAGFPIPSIKNNGTGSSYKPQQSPSTGNQTRNKRSPNLSNPSNRNVASPTIATATPVVLPAMNRVNYVEDIEDEETTSNPALPIAGSTGLLTLLFWVRGKKRKSTVEVDPTEHEAQPGNLINESLDEFISGERLLYTLIPKQEDSVWENAIAFDPTVLAVEINSDQILTLHEDGNIRLEKSSSTKPEILSLGTWQKQGVTPQITSAGLPFFALGLNIKGQLNICQGKQSEKSFLEEQKPMSLPKNLHSIQHAMIKHNKLWVIGEQFNQSIALSATIEHGKVKKWKNVIPQDAAAGEIKGISTSGRDLIAYSTDDESNVIRIYQRDKIRGGWELIAKSSYAGGHVALCMDEKRCFMVEWVDDSQSIAIHAFTRNEEGRFAGHYVNQVELPFEAELSSATFQYGKLMLQGKQTTPKGETRIVSCSASIRKLLGVTTTV